MEKILTTLLIFTVFTGFLAFLLTLAKKNHRQLRDYQGKNQ